MAQMLRLEHRILSEFRQREWGNINLLVALSGGLDSVALLYLFHNLSSLLKIQIFVGHIHHGWIQGSQGDFRGEAWGLCKKICQKLDLPFYSNLLELKPEPRFLIEPKTTLKSEEEMRNFRYDCLEKFRKQLQESFLKPTFIATAHSADDQLETRLMQLIRGSGEQGVKAMNWKTENILRPLLSCSRQELREYIKTRKATYIDDPSNLSLDPFRNWLRNEWLFQLEKKRQGSVLALARSLRHLSEEKNSQAEGLEKLISEKAIQYPLFLELSLEQKKRVLAIYMRVMNMKNYTLSHILEILKRLDSPSKEHKFILLKHYWTINAEQIKASLV